MNQPENWAIPEYRLLTKVVETKSMKIGNCMIYANDLYIAYSDDARYWRWHKLPEDREVDVAELIKISHLEVTGSVPMSRFTPGEKYEVLFVLKRTESAQFTTVARFNLELPNGTTKSRIVSIMTLKPNQWSHVKVGTFRGARSAADIKFSLRITDKSWKEGLFVGGVLVQHVAYCGFPDKNLNLLDEQDPVLLICKQIQCFLHALILNIYKKQVGVGVPTSPS